jgi:hypothetical protein
MKAFAQAYAKGIIAVGAALGVIGTAFADGQLSEAEYGSIVVAVVGAIGVIAKANKPQA